MLEIFLKGIGFGLAVAAPVGPIGLLCLKRTISDGRAAGLATGLGAATADGLYGLVVAAGFTATGLLLAYTGPLQIGGGLLIAFLGLQAIRGFLSGTKQADASGGNGAYRGVWAAYLTTFVLTLANPMTILAFVGMIAALGAAASVEGAAYWLVFGVFSGSALWWLFLVHVALWARSRMSLRILHWVDLAAGLVLLIWGLWIAGSGLSA